MKYLLLCTLFPLISHAGFSSPELVARFMAFGALNAPDNTWCFSGEPVALRDDIYLNCLDGSSNFMARWRRGKFESLSRAQSQNLFSRPLSAFNKISWYEFTEFSTVKAYNSRSRVETISITNLGPKAEYNDSFLPLTSDSFFFKTKGEKPQLWKWQRNSVSLFFNPEAAFIFSPHIGSEGEITLKTRDEHLNENAPDKLWHFQKAWQVILEDKDSNPSSRWKSFRHQLAVEGNKVLLVANDGRRDSLILTDGKRIEVIARAGIDLKSFDYFAPKMRAGTIVVRGEDFKGNKVVYVKDRKGFRKLISQGDIVETDLGPGKIQYESQNAIFYGAPGIDEKGNIYLQATLTNATNADELLGVGLLKFKKE